MLIVSISATCNADNHDNQLIRTIAQVELQILMSKTLMNCSEFCNYVKFREPIVFNLSNLLLLIFCTVWYNFSFVFQWLSNKML